MRIANLNTRLNASSTSFFPIAEPEKICPELQRRTQEFFGKDSDMLYQALKLIIDRCGTDDVKLFKFFNYIKTFPSQLDMDIDDTVFNGVCKK